MLELCLSAGRRETPYPETGVNFRSRNCLGSRRSLTLMFLNRRIVWPGEQDARLSPEIYSLDDTHVAIGKEVAV